MAQYTCAHVKGVDEVDALAIISEDATLNMVHTNQTLPDDLQRAVERLTKTRPCGAEVVARFHRVKWLIRKLGVASVTDMRIAGLDALHLPKDERKALKRHVEQLAWLMYRLTGKREIPIYFRMRANTSSHGFHVDGVTLRLLQPLRGKGTEWTPFDNAVVDNSGENVEVRDETRVNALAEGTISLHRGWKHKQPWVHRAPKNAGQNRLLMVMDA